MLLLPNNLQILIFGNKFNKCIGRSIYSYLPNSIKKLTFGFNFNQKTGYYVSYIPETVVELNFGFGFNQKLYYKEIYHIPKSVQSLQLGIHYLDRFSEIPKTVKKISLINENNIVVKTINR